MNSYAICTFKSICIQQEMCTYVQFVNCTLQIHCIIPGCGTEGQDRNRNWLNSVLGIEAKG